MTHPIRSRKKQRLHYGRGARFQRARHVGNVPHGFLRFDRVGRWPSSSVPPGLMAAESLAAEYFVAPQRKRRLVRPAAGGESGRHGRAVCVVGRCAGCDPPSAADGRAGRRSRSSSACGAGCIGSRGRWCWSRPTRVRPRRPSSSRHTPGERPVLSGGQAVGGFRQNGELWETVLPDVKAGRWYFRQLFVDGQRRQLARGPNSGYYHTADLLPGPPDAHGKAIARDKFVFAPGDLKPWQRLGDVNLVLMHSWETSIHPLKSVDVKTNIVEFAAAEGVVVHRLLGAEATLLRGERPGTARPAGRMVPGPSVGRVELLADAGREAGRSGNRRARC